MFEPWYIVDRFRNPWYDTRFRGYGMDKQQQVTAAALDRKLMFMVHPTAFVVHMPHKKPQTFRQYMSAVAARKSGPSRCATARRTAHRVMPKKKRKGSDKKRKDYSPRVRQ
ncbi:uncharacterized protein HaLaN_16062 [Haematococcus lacustris]|uniref:Uncharacterized protein n=1 Tax=Haematococcus lacustris TaxID=44745 RepID=A0A699ZKV5_HAELA|nr:uncharacterized protein HaLaN_16062 [Haematococcus lacustris]